MKVDQESHSSSYLKKLQNSQRNLVKKKEHEIKKLNQLYNDKVSISKTQGDIELADQQEKNQEQINNSINAKEQKLVAIKNDLTKNSETLNKQRQLLQDQFKQQIENTNLNADERLKQVHYDNKTKNREMVDMAKEDLDILRFNTKQEISNKKYQSKMQADRSARSADRGIKNLERVQSLKEEGFKKQNEADLKQMADEHQNKLNSTKREHFVEHTNKKNTQSLELKHMEDHHKNILKQKRDTFKERYGILEKNHTEILTRIKDRFDNEVKQLVQKYSDFKNQKLSKLDDKFYNIKKIEPLVKDGGKFYQVEIKVPEHEKDLINLTAQNRKLYVSLTRKYDDKMDDQVGSQFKTRRSEVLSKTLELPDIMNSKKIVQNYNEGKLTFKIDKL